MSSNQIAQLFKDKFKKDPLMIKSPGRVNLIGEHTDYNEGFVLPAAIDKGIDFAIALNNKDQINLVSRDLNDIYQASTDNIDPVEKSWANYLLGVVAQFKEKGIAIPGFDCVFGGNIPVGAGLSSSAALECGLAMGLNEMLSLGISKMDLVKMAQKAEHTYAGVQCGIMDQFASVFGKADHVVRLDCRSLDYDYFPFKMEDYQLLLCNTKVSHSLASSEYNTRRQECEAGVRVLQKNEPEIGSLRDVSMELLEAHKAEIDPIVFQRCAYVVGENDRVIQACEALQNEDLERFGEYMYASHKGLQHEYEVSCPELDFLVAQTRNNPDVLGARMMGGGFGGCTINLVRIDAVADLSQQLVGTYLQKFGEKPEIYEALIQSGTHIIDKY